MPTHLALEALALVAAGHPHPGTAELLARGWVVVTPAGPVLTLAGKVRIYRW